MAVPAKHPKFDHFSVETHGFGNPPPHFKKLPSIMVTVGRVERYACGHLFNAHSRFFVVNMNWSSLKMLKKKTFHPLVNYYLPSSNGHWDPFGSHFSSTFSGGKKTSLLDGRSADQFQPWRWLVSASLEQQKLLQDLSMLFWSQWHNQWHNPQPCVGPPHQLVMSCQAADNR